MTTDERKRAFRGQAALDGRTLAGAAHEVCSVTWEHLSAGIAGTRPLSDEVKQKFAAYIGRSVEDVFGGEQASSAA